MSPILSFSNLCRNSAIFVLIVLGTAGRAIGSANSVESACTPQEKWSSALLNDLLPTDTQGEFVRFLSGERQPFAAFAEITGLREGGMTRERAAFIDYWLGRTLFAVGLYSESSAYFDNLVSLKPQHERLATQVAAMACLQRVHELAPQVEYSRKAISNIPAYYEPWLMPKADLPILWEATVHHALSLFKDGKASAVESALVLLEGSGPYELFVEGLWAIEKNDMEVAAASLAKLLALSKLPPSVAKRKNELRLLLGTALYATEDHKGAAKQLELIDKKSNDLVQAQALLASAQMLSDQVSKSIASAAVLKSDAFRSAFAPEAYTTLAMGLIDICRYPEARSNLNDFRKEYENSYRWLKRQLAGEEGSVAQIYPVAVAFLEGRESGVPPRVASEWMRSPIFISHQAAINSAFQGARNVDRLSEGVKAARLAAAEELKKAEEALVEAKQSEEKKPDSKELGVFKQASFEAAVASIKARMGRLDKAEPLWSQFLVQHKESASRETEKLGIAIERHLRRVNERMLAQLDRVIENNEAVEAELLNSATQDMVVQSSDPQELEKRKLASTSRKAVDEARDFEVWEDELGVSEVSIQNNCQPMKGRAGKGSP